MNNQYDKLINDVDTMLENIQTEYETKTFDYAEKVFNEVIKPWIDKHNYKFYAGNGDWLITDDKDMNINPIWKANTIYRSQQSNKIPKYILDILNTDVFDKQTLGSIMPNYSINRNNITGLVE